MAGILQELDRIVRPQGRVFYGWWIVASSSGVQWLAAVLWNRELFPPLPSAVGYLGVLIPLLFTEIRFLK